MTINPDFGSRTWTGLVRVDTLKRDDTALGWRTDTGQRPTDEWFAANGFYGFVDPGPPAINGAVERVFALSEYVIDQVACTATQTYLVSRLQNDEIRALITAERDRRSDGGMIFAGLQFQTAREDRENIAGASSLAIAAMISGAQPGNLRWHGGDSDFVWIAQDNSEIPMDAQTLFALGQAAAKWKSAHIFAAKALKQATPIPDDYLDDAYWPSNGA